MKLILDETVCNKLVLSEKLQLSEKMFLTEAKADELASLEKLIELVEKILVQLESGGMDPEVYAAWSSLKHSCTNTRSAINTATDHAIIQGKVKEFISQASNWINKIKTNDNSANELKDFFNDLRPMADIPNPDDTQIEKISSLLNSMVVKLLVMQGGISDLNLRDTIKKAETSLKTTLSTAYKIKKLVDKLPSSSDSIDAKMSGLSAKIDTLITDLTAAGDDFAKINEIATDFNTGIKSDLDTFIATLSAADKGELDAEDEKSQTNRAGKMDWNSQYQMTSDKDAFWKRYYKTVYGNMADRINNLGKAYRKDCLENGFDEGKNPLIKFIKKNVLAGNKFNMTAESYLAILNSRNNNILPDEILNNLDENSSNNPIYCKEFYTAGYDTRSLESIIRINANLVRTPSLVTDEDTLKDKISDYKNTDFYSALSKALDDISTKSMDPVNAIIYKGDNSSDATNKKIAKAKEIVNVTQILYGDQIASFGIVLTHTNMSKPYNKIEKEYNASHSPYRGEILYGIIQQLAIHFLFVKVSDVSRSSDSTDNGRSEPSNVAALRAAWGKLAHDLRPSCDSTPYFPKPDLDDKLVKVDPTDATKVTAEYIKNTRIASEVNTIVNKSGILSYSCRTPDVIIAFITKLVELKKK